MNVDTFWQRNYHMLATGIVDRVLKMEQGMSTPLWDAIREASWSSCERCDGEGECAHPHDTNCVGFVGCPDCHGAGGNEAEVYEWYFVDEYLAKRLEAYGEVVIDGELVGGCAPLWGRQTTGQMVSADWVIEQIAQDVERSIA